MKKKIGILAGHSISPNMQAVLYNFGRMLHNEFELHLITGQKTIPERLNPYYKVFYSVTYSIDPANLIYSLSAAIKYLNICKPDAFMNIAQTSLAAAVSATGKYFKIPTVVRMVGDTFHESKVGETILEKLKNYIIHGIIGGLSYKNASYVLAIGKNLSDKLVDKGIRPNKIITIPQPFDELPFLPLSNEKKKQLKQSLGLSPKKKTVLFVGRVSWMKGADRLFEIIKLVNQSSNKFQFCIVGHGELLNKFEIFSKDIVVKTGLLPHDQINTYFKSADLLIFPSRSEGCLPNTILEALACKIPVIASPVGGIANCVSTLATKPETYTDYILNGNWKVDELPEAIKFDKLKERYIDFFRSFTETK